ncbi:hypothetical protein ACLBKT_09260 [Erythrobacter sp. W302b]|uniref:hypothetical protein n=1 Tax=Erythrobacter sp. W302b TaxID=3389874 RepID=UPI00396B2C84
MFWNYSNYETVRAGNWKLQVNEKQPKAWLFNLAEQPTWQRILSANYSQNAPSGRANSPPTTPDAALRSIPALST